MKAELKKLCVASACATGLLLAAVPAQAANWLMLHGTERPNAKQKWWGFVQPAYTKDLGDPLSGLVGAAAANNGKRSAGSSIAPYFTSDSRWHLRRARVGVRGNFTGAFRTPFTSKMNFFTLFELAPNLLTFDPFGNRARRLSLDHMSLTFNHIKGARIRAGLFKTPGPEESFNAIHVLNYIEFTDFIAREVLERFTTGAQQPTGSNTSPTLGTPTNVAYGFNGVRDWGVQVFDRFKSGRWAYSYAVMVGRGESINHRRDRNGANELYLYGSAEYDLPGGRGPYKHGIKLFSWYQKGKRRFSSDASGASYDRKRYGFGVFALGKLFGGRHRHRVSAEFMFADGMLFLGPAGGVKGGNLIYAAESGNKSRAFYVDYGFFLNRKWEFDIRYARHELLYERNANINPGNERLFKEVTLGVQYRPRKKMRLTLNYIIKDASAPNAYTATGGLSAGQANAVTNNVKQILKTLDRRVALQLTWIF